MPTATRLPPTDEAGLQDKTLQSLAPYRGGRSRIYAIFAALAHHEDALRRFLVFSNHILGKNTFAIGRGS